MEILCLWIRCCNIIGQMIVCILCACKRCAHNKQQTTHFHMHTPFEATRKFILLWHQLRLLLLLLDPLLSFLLLQYVKLLVLWRWTLASGVKECACNMQTKEAHSIWARYWHASRVCSLRVLLLLLILHLFLLLFLLLHLLLLLLPLLLSYLLHQVQP